MKIHELKTWPEFFTEAVGGHKRFELRRNDRDFQCGDDIQLKEWCPIEKKYTGRSKQFKIKTMLQNFQGLKKGYCILGI